MVVSFVVNPVEWGWSPWDTRVGGSEECVIEWSRRLSERGHDVRVYHNGQHGEFNGVSYRERTDYLHRRGQGVTVNVNYPDLAPQEPTLYWSTLDTNNRDLSAFQTVAYISEYQRQHCFEQPHRNMVWLPPGYDSQSIYPETKIPRTVLYASSPDRGLSTLLGEWPQVAAAHPDAQLIITYGGRANTPNTICLGEVSTDGMNELYRTSDIWCHPANGGELYCITGIKAQAAGCIPVVFPTMALDETVKDGFFCRQSTLADALIDALEGEDLDIRDNLAKIKFPDWQSTTDILEQQLLALA